MISRKRSFFFYEYSTRQPYKLLHDDVESDLYDYKCTYFGAPYRNDRKYFLKPQ